VALCICRWVTSNSGNGADKFSIMSSTALIGWQTSRKARLDQMFVNCATCGVDALNQCYFEVLAIRLASEFQGFCRSLHDECIEFVAGLSPALTQLVRNLLQYERKLDHKNASPDSLRLDFERFPIGLLVLLQQDSPPKANDWWKTIGDLNVARNAGAHDSEANRVKLSQPLTPNTCQTWRNDLDELVVAMDRVIKKEFLVKFGAEPW
jgi:hypothetical protein